MITIDYNIIIIIISTLIYTVLVHLFNWWAREVEHHSEQWVNTTFLIIFHIVPFSIFIFIITYPLL